MINFLSSNSFSWSSLTVVVVLLSIASIVPIVLSLLHLRIIPCLVVEFVIGISIAFIEPVRNLFINVDTNQLQSFPEGLYLVGMTFLLFLSGLDTDFSVFKKEYKNEKECFNVLKISWIIILCVIGLSFLLSLLFLNIAWPSNKILGVILLTICFSSTFASIVIPLVHNENLQKTTIGKIISTYSTIAEFLAILAISILLISEEIAHDSKPWLLIIVVVIQLIIYVLLKFTNKSIFSSSMGGIVHLGTRLIVLTVLGLSIITDMSGAEFILGSFLAGMVIKSAKVSHETMEKVESLGYGLFVPMFYILVGLKVGISLSFSLNNLLLILVLFLVLVIAKLPFLLLIGKYKLSTIVPTIFIASCTLIVSITLEHFSIFDEEFISCLIFASALTCIIPPILFDTNKTFGYATKKWEDIIIEPCDLENLE